MNFYKRHLGDYAKDAGHLSMLEHGAYTLLLDRYYSTEKPIHWGDAYRVCRARSGPEKAAVDAVVAEFFAVDGEGLLRSRRADEEIAKASHQRDVNQAVGKLGGRPKRTESGAASQTESVPESQTESVPVRNPSQTPDTRHQKKKTPLTGAPWIPPEWVPAKAWSDFEQHRKAMRRVPFTDAAREGVVRELEKLQHKGHDPAELLQTAITRGWRTVFEPRAQAGPAAVMSFRERDHEVAAQRVREMTGGLLDDTRRGDVIDMEVPDGRRRIAG